MAKKVHDAVAMQAMKALVAIYGPREAARISGIPAGTVLSYASQHKWKRAAINRPGNQVDPNKRDVADVLVAALEKHKEESTLHLAEFTARASREAANHSKPLDIARKVRDVAGVYSTLWPAEEGGELIEGAILLGTARVTDNPGEILELTKVSDVSDVRKELPDKGPSSD